MKLRPLSACILAVLLVAVGFMMGRSTVDPRDGSTGVSRGSAGPPGKLAERSRFPSERHGPGAGRGAKSGQSPAIAIRNAIRKLSPMAGMDYDSFFDAYEAIRTMSSEEVRVALDELEGASINLQVQKNLRMMLISHWAKQEGQAAVEYAIEIEDPMQMTSALVDGLASWAKTDPESACTWYQEHGDELGRGKMGEGYLDGIFFASIAQRDTRRGFTLLKGLKKSKQEAALKMLMVQTPSMEPAKKEEFLAELEQIEDENLRRSGMRNLVDQWVRQDPGRAVEFVESREWESSVGEDLREDLALSWSYEDPEAALDWQLTTLDEQEDRGEMVAAPFSRWWRRDTEAATAWLEKQAEDLRTDAFYRGTSDQLRMIGAHESAAAWAEQIQEEDQRSRTLELIYREWEGDDEKTAQQWFDGLDASIRSGLEGHADLE